jgi:D-alanyl-D-alanine carboxypeptidase
MRNHNRLLGQVEGMDGIKTGFTRASGFNLVTSVRRGNRHIVAVVLGGRSAGARDARMRDLIGQYIVEASTRRVAPAIAEAGAPAETRAKVQVAAAGEPSAILATPRQSLTEPAGRADPAATAAIPPAAAFAGRTIQGPTAASGKALNLGSTDPIKPVLVKTIPVKAGAIQSASLDPVPSANLVGSNASRMRPGAASERDAAPAARRGTLGALPASSIRHDDAATARAAEPAPRRASSDGGWMIQVGAFPGEGEAKERLQEVRSKAKNLLGAADPFTEKVIKGEKALYRARFAGLEKEQAEAACKQLKRSEIACMALKN